jgi:hypothetical protein
MRVYEVLVVEKDKEDDPIKILVDDKFIAGSEMSAGMKAFEKAKEENPEISLDDIDIKVRPF